MEKPFYTMKEVSQRFEISEYTIRYYTDCGLLSAMRDKNNNRLFNEEALSRLKTILCLRGCGMSIKELQEYFTLCEEGENTIQQRYEIILRQKHKAEQALKETQDQLSYIEWKLKKYEDNMHMQKQKKA